MFLNSNFSVYPCTAAITRGVPAALNSAGTVTAQSSSGGNGYRCIGIAHNSPEAAGQFCVVQTRGICDYATTDGNLADSDVLVIANDGNVIGMTLVELASATMASLPLVVGKALGVADVGTVGKILITCGN